MKFLLFFIVFIIAVEQSLAAFFQPNILNSPSYGRKQFCYNPGASPAQKYTLACAPQSAIKIRLAITGLELAGCSNNNGLDCSESFQNVYGTTAQLQSICDGQNTCDISYNQLPNVQCKSSPRVSLFISYQCVMSRAKCNHTTLSYFLKYIKYYVFLFLLRLLSKIIHLLVIRLVHVFKFHLVVSKFHLF